MKTKCTTRWLTTLAGLLLAVPVLGLAAQGGIPKQLAQCEADLAACLAEPCAIFPGDGLIGAPLIYTDNGDGTFTDDNTGLMWEMKTGTVGYWVECSHNLFPPACINVADVNNRYTWTDPTDDDNTDPDGTAFTFFLEMRNETCGGLTWGSMGCTEATEDVDCADATFPYCGLGGHTDWRLPTVKELQSLVDYSTFYPAASFPGEVANSHYWSYLSSAYYEYIAWNVGFSHGGVYYYDKDIDYHVRAVRGGW